MENETNKQIEKKNEMNISIFRLILIVVSAIVLTAGVTAFAILSGNEKFMAEQSAKRSEFLKLYAVYDTLNGDYYKKVDKEKLVDSAIKGMVSGLDDPYSEYMTKSEQVEFTDSMSGDFQGIGAEMAEDDGKILITSPIKGSPADKAGIQPNDELTAIDGKSTKGMNTYDVVKKIRGKKGTTVTLTIKRGSAEPFNVKIKRDTVHMNSVESKMLKNKVALITVTKFQEGTASEFHNALEAMHKKGMKKLVLDFRNNPGGYLEQARQMANEFVDKGNTILYTEDNKKKLKRYKAANEANAVTKNLPTVIILNEGSASASEVFAAALKENNKAEIVGTKSFGKGIVQTASTFKDKSMIKYTESKWLTPDKHWIHKKGIQPDKKIDLPAFANIHILDADDAYVIGEKNDRVKSLETGLKALGYTTGKVDRTLDETTAAAIAAFQVDHELEVNSQMTGKTTEAFTKALRDKLAKDDTQLNGAVKYVKTLK